MVLQTTTTTRMTNDGGKDSRSGLVNCSEEKRRILFSSLALSLSFSFAFVLGFTIFHLTLHHLKRRNLFFATTDSLSLSGTHPLHRLAQFVFFKLSLFKQNIHEILGKCFRCRRRKSLRKWWEETNVRLQRQRRQQKRRYSAPSWFNAEWNEENERESARDQE